MTLATELVQSAAVLTAIIEKLNREGGYEGQLDTRLATMEISTERIRQNIKWGPQRDHSLVEWFMILIEELGEAVDELPDLRVDDSDGIHSAMILGVLSALGVEARNWIEGHDWPERQQEVIDREVEGE